MDPASELKIKKKKPEIDQYGSNEEFCGIDWGRQLYFAVAGEQYGRPQCCVLSKASTT